MLSSFAISIILKFVIVMPPRPAKFEPLRIAFKCPLIKIFIHFLLLIRAFCPIYPQDVLINNPESSFYVHKEHYKFQNLICLGQKNKEIPLACEIRKIDGKPAIPLSCFSSCEKLKIPEYSESPLAIRLKLFSEGKPTEEYPLSYPSTVKKVQWYYKVASFLDLPQKEWYSKTIQLPKYTKPTSKDYHLSFERGDFDHQYWITREFSHRYRLPQHSASPRRREILLNSSERHWSQSKLWLHSFEFLQDHKLDLDIQTQIQSNTQTVLEDYPALWLVPLFFIVVLFYLKERRLGFRILLSLLGPVSLLYIVFAYSLHQHLNLSSQNEAYKLLTSFQLKKAELESALDQAQGQLQSKFKKAAVDIKPLLAKQNQGSQSIPSATLEYLEHIDKKKVFDKEELEKLILVFHDLSLKNIESLKSRGLVSKEAAELDKGQVNSILNGKLNETAKLQSLQFFHLPSLYYLRHFYQRTGMTLYLTNGDWCIKSDGINLGVRRVTSIESVLYRLILQEMEINTDNQAREVLKKEAVFTEMRSEFEAAGFPTDQLELFVNLPNHFHDLLSDDLSPNYERQIWSTIRGENSNWILVGHLLQNGLIAEIDSFLKNKDSSIDVDFLGTGLHPDAPYLSPRQNKVQLIASKKSSSEGDLFVYEHSDEGSFFAYSYHLDRLPQFIPVLSTPAKPLFKRIYKQKIQVILLFFACCLILCLLSIFLGHRVSRAIQSLESGVKDLQTQNFDQAIVIDGNSEFANIARKLEQLRISLKQKNELVGFLSRQTAQSILSDSSKTEVTTRQNCYVLFCGILLHTQDQGSEHLEVLLNKLQTAIASNGGLIDKFTGVALMGILKDPDPVQLREVIHSIQAELSDSSITGSKIGIGIAHGPLVLGKVGSSGRMDFTGIGNTVNLSARLESLALQRESSLNILCDEMVASHLKLSQDQVLHSDGVSIKGKQNKVMVYVLS